LKELVALCLESVSHDESDAGSEKVDEVRKLEKNSNGVQATGGEDTVVVKRLASQVF
jgi:hypothetical protein